MRHATPLHPHLHRLGATLRFGGMAGMHFAPRLAAAPVFMRAVAGRVF